MNVDGYENYLIYEDGRVFSKNNNKFLKPDTIRSGYFQIALYKNKERKRFLIHRLVALHYVNNPRPDKYNIVDHLDRNKLNNNRTNLRWVDNYINSQNRTINKNNKLREQYIVYLKQYNNPYRFQITRNKNLHKKQFKTIEEAKNYRDNFLLEQIQEQ